MSLVMSMILMRTPKSGINFVLKKSKVASLLWTLVRRFSLIFISSPLQIALVGPLGQISYIISVWEMLNHVVPCKVQLHALLSRYGYQPKNQSMYHL